MKYPDLRSEMKPVPYSEELPVPQPLKNVAFSDNTSNCDEDHGQQEGDNADCDPTFEARCSSEPHLLTQGDLNDTVRQFNLFKKQLLGSRLKGCNLIHRNGETCSFAIAKMNSRNFSLKNRARILY